MFKHASGTEKESGTDYDHLAPRTIRAATSPFSTDWYAHPKGSGKVDVYSSGKRYTVDLRADVKGKRSCTCPDAEHNLGADESCKHARRVKMEIGTMDVPAEIPIGEIDAELIARADRFGVDLSEPTVEEQAAAVVRTGSGRAVATDGGRRE